MFIIKGSTNRGHRDNQNLNRVIRICIGICIFFLFYLCISSPVSLNVKVNIKKKNHFCRIVNKYGQKYRFALEKWFSKLNLILKF